MTEGAGGWDDVSAADFEPVVVPVEPHVEPAGVIDPWTDVDATDFGPRLEPDDQLALDEARSEWAAAAVVPPVAEPVDVEPEVIPPAAVIEPVSLPPASFDARRTSFTPPPTPVPAVEPAVTAVPATPDAKVGFRGKLKSLGKRLFYDSEELRTAESAKKNQKIDEEIASENKASENALKALQEHNAGKFKMNDELRRNAAIQIIHGLAGRHASPEAQVKLKLAQDTLSTKTEEDGKDIITVLPSKGQFEESKEEIEKRQTMKSKNRDDEAKLKDALKAGEKEQAKAAQEAAKKALERVKLTSSHGAGVSREELAYLAKADLFLGDPKNFNPDRFRNEVEKDFNLQGEENHENWWNLVHKARALADTGLTESAFRKMLESEDEVEREHALELLEVMPPELQAAFKSNHPDLQKRFRVNAGVTPEEEAEETVETVKTADNRVVTVFKGVLRKSMHDTGKTLREIQKKLQDGEYVSPDDYKNALIASNRANSEYFSFFKDRIVDKKAKYWKTLADQADLTIDRGKLVPNLIDLDPKDGTLKEQLPKILGDRNVDAIVLLNQEQLKEYRNVDLQLEKQEDLKITAEEIIKDRLNKDVSPLGFEVSITIVDNKVRIDFRKKTS